MEILQRKYRVAEVYGDFWLNGTPISLNAHHGSVILLHFWDYTSLQSLRTLPYIQEWYRRYEGLGLVLLGVHTPMFPFARDPGTVQQAADRLGLHHPIVLDNDYFAWGRMGIRTRPTMILVDKNGFQAYRHEGEGMYQSMEHAIQSLLAEAGYHEEFPLIMEPLRDIDIPGAWCYKSTPEILVGYQHGCIGNVEGYTPEGVALFTDPGYYLEGRVYLNGYWKCNRDFLQLSNSELGEGGVSILYQARETYVIVKPEGEKNFQVFVTQDDLPISAENMGEDIRFDNDGQSFFLVTQPRLYQIVANQEFGEHRLRLTARSSGFALYGFSFASSVIANIVSEN